MALPTAVISFSAAGRLRIFLTARYTRSNSDVGFPNASAGTIRLRAYLGPSGSYVYTPTIDKFSLAATVEAAYPGANVSWNVGVEAVEWQAATGTVIVAMRDIRVAWELVKR